MKKSKIKRIVLGATMIALIGGSFCGCSSDKAKTSNPDETVATEEGARTRNEAVEIWLEAQNNKDWDLFKTVLPTPLMEDEEYCEEMRLEFEKEMNETEPIECLETSYSSFEDESYTEHCGLINEYFERELGRDVEDIEPENIYRLYISLRPVDAPDDQIPNTTYYYVYNDGGRYFVSNYLGEFSFGG